VAAARLRPVPVRRVPAVPRVVPFPLGSVMTLLIGRWPWHECSPVQDQYHHGREQHRYQQ
jgi:hypothetical protein